MNNVKPRFNAQMEGTVLPLFLDRGLTPLVYFHGHSDGIPLVNYAPETKDRVRVVAMNARHTLARIVAESRRPKP